MKLPADHLDPAGRVIVEHLPAVAAVPGGEPAVALRALPRDTAAFTGRTANWTGWPPPPPRRLPAG